MGEFSKIAILGGITINLEGNNQDLFLPLTFEVRGRDYVKEISMNNIKATSQMVHECFNHSVVSQIGNEGYELS